jgi:hypothetical protein
MVRACRAMPQYNGCCLVENRLRSPPLLRYFPHYQHTTVVCGGGGLNKYQGVGADTGPRGCGGLRELVEARRRSTLSVRL